MDSRRPKVAILGTRFRDFSIEREILGDVELTSGPGASSDDILRVAAGADVILAGAAPRFDDATLSALGCRGIVRLGVGVDGVDLPAATRLGLWVVNVPDYGTEAVALHTVTLVLAGLRRLTTADRRMRAAEWGVAELRPLHLPEGLTVGVVGFGRIGRRVAGVLAGVGFGRFLVADPAVTGNDVAAELGDHSATLVTMSDLLTGSDVVTLHTPPPPDGYLIGGDELGKMKEGALLVNTARGALIDTAALVSALGTSRPGFAALDVYEQEPPDVAVFEPVADRVTLTPHMSWYTEESEMALRRLAAEEAARIIAAETPRHAIVSPDRAEVG